MFARLGRVFYRTRWTVLVAALLIFVAAAIFGSGVFGSLKDVSFSDPASESSRAQNLLDTKLVGSTTDVVILIRSETLKVTDPTFRDAATPLLAKLQARSEVASVTSYYSTHSSSFLSRTGHETFALVQLEGKDQSTKEKDFQALEPLINSPTLHILVGGNVPFNVALNAQVSADLERAELLAFPIVAILLLIVFQSVVAAGLPLLIGGVTILGAFATLRILTTLTDISVYAVNIVSMMGLGLAIDYALFMVTRFREELVPDENDVRGALARTMATAGRTVAFSGLIVGISLLGLLLFPEPYLHSLGIGAIAAICIVLVASLTILPAILALLGHRVNALSIQHLLRRPSSAKRSAGSSALDKRGAWYRLSEAVMRWPVPVVLVVFILLVVLGIPFLHISFEQSDVRVLPSGQPARIVSDRLTQDFTQPGNAQLVVALHTPGAALSATNLANLDAYVRHIQTIPGVIRVDSLVTVAPSLSLAAYQQIYAHPGVNPQLTAIAAQLAHDDTTKITVFIQPADRTAAAEEIVRQIRAISAPGGLVPLVDGTTPRHIDLLASLSATIPKALLVIIVAIFVLLFLMTGSLLIPVKAVILNTLSLTATFGALVWIFQDGNLHNLLGLQSIGSIDASQPVLIFAVAFGLSMDYQVFLLSRIKERFDEIGDNRAAIASGLQRTGWLITSAAGLIAVVFASFGGAKIIAIQEIGVGLAIAVIVDATLVRILLVPATMRLLGQWNWWAPAPLQAIYRRIGLSETAVAAVGTSNTSDTGVKRRFKSNSSLHP